MKTVLENVMGNHEGLDFEKVLLSERVIAYRKVLKKILTLNSLAMFILYNFLILIVLMLLTLVFTIPKYLLYSYGGICMLSLMSILFLLNRLEKKEDKLLANDGSIRSFKLFIYINVLKELLDIGISNHFQQLNALYLTKHIENNYKSIQSDLEDTYYPIEKTNGTAMIKSLSISFERIIKENLLKNKTIEVIQFLDELEILYCLFLKVKNDKISLEKFPYLRHLIRINGKIINFQNLTSLVGTANVYKKLDKFHKKLERKNRLKGKIREYKAIFIASPKLSSIVILFAIGIILVPLKSVFPDLTGMVGDIVAILGLVGGIVTVFAYMESKTNKK
jgi:hypothetical protein